METATSSSWGTFVLDNLPFLAYPFAWLSAFWLPALALDKYALISTSAFNGLILAGVATGIVLIFQMRLYITAASSSNDYLSWLEQCEEDGPLESVQYHQPQP